jgi:hypothetical protein
MRPFIPLFLLPFIVFGIGCGESSYDAYLEGLRLSGEAERGVCGLAWDKQEKSHVISSASVDECIRAMRLALAAMERAEELGQTGKDFESTLEDTKVAIERLESMKRSVGMMEVGQVLDQ